MRLTKRIAIAAGALTLGATGIAAAAGPPQEADDGLANASDQVGVDLPASKDSHPGANENATDEGSGDDSVDEVLEGSGPEDNHGAEVSVVAKSDETSGRDHGIAVSEVARQGHGRGPTGDHPAGDLTD